MRHISTLLITLIAALGSTDNADAFEPVLVDLTPIELPEAHPLPEACLPADCVDDALVQYGHCFPFTVIHADMIGADLCIRRLNIRLDCCQGIAPPGVVCPEEN